LGLELDFWRCITGPPRSAWHRTRSSCPRTNLVYSSSVPGLRPLDEAEELGTRPQNFQCLGRHNLRSKTSIRRPGLEEWDGVENATTRTKIRKQVVEVV
jgi:hypothetical protein